MVSESSGYWVALSQGESIILARELKSLYKIQANSEHRKSYPMVVELLNQLDEYLSGDKDET